MLSVNAELNCFYRFKFALLLRYLEQLNSLPRHLFDQRQLGRQSDLVQVVALDDGLPGPAAQVGEGLGFGERFDRLPGKGIRVKEIDQKPIR